MKDRPEDSMLPASLEIRMTEQSLVEEADRRLVEISTKNGNLRFQPKNEITGRCITEKKMDRSRSPTDDHKSVYNKHLSIADELDGLSDDDNAPEDWTPKVTDHTLVLPSGVEEPLENVDLNTIEIHEDSTVVEPARTSMVYENFKPKEPSRLAFELQETDPEDNACDAVPRQASEATDRDTECDLSEVGISLIEEHIEEQRIEEENPWRPRLDAWLEESYGEGTRPSWEEPLEDPTSDKRKHCFALDVIAEHDDVRRSSSDFRDEEPDSSLTDVQLTSRGTSQSTRVSSSDISSSPKPITDDHDWCDRVDFIEDTDLQSLKERVRVHPPVYIPDEKPLPPPPQPATNVKSVAVKGDELGGFIESSVLKVNAIRANRKDKHASSKVKDIQHLVEKVLIDEMCGERKSLSDMLDGSAWRT